MDTNNIQWNDLQMVLALARAGSLLQAAPLLGASHPTLHRRLKALERDVGVSLFRRDRKGHHPTELADELIALAQHIESELHRIGLQWAKHQLQPYGKVRLTAPDALMHSLLPPILALLREHMPSLTLEVSTSDALFNLSRREADVALRAGSSPPEDLIGRKVCTIAVCAYAPIAWQDARLAHAELHPWVVPDDNLGHLASFAWLSERGLAQQPAARGNSLNNIASMAAAGMGLAMLPCYLGDTLPGLWRLSPPLPDLASDLWLLTHPELRQVQRVRQVVEHLLESLQTQRPLLEGECPRR